MYVCMYVCMSAFTLRASVLFILNLETENQNDIIVSSEALSYCKNKKLVSKFCLPLQASLLAATVLS